MNFINDSRNAAFQPGELIRRNKSANSAYANWFQPAQAGCAYLLPWL
jgi:hypothetical protein